MVLSQRLKEFFGKDIRSLEQEWGLSNGYINKVASGKIQSQLKIRQILHEKGLNPDLFFNPDLDFNLNLSNHQLQDTSSVSVAPSVGRIPLLRQTVSCGPGQSWEDADVVEEYLEPLMAFPSFKDADVYAFRARGLSMVGVGIQDGDILFFDGRRRVLTDDLYVFALDGNVYCKLLKFDTIQKLIQIYSVQSHNLAEAELIHTIDMNKESSVDRIHIFGRVLAWIHENRVMWR